MEQMKDSIVIELSDYGMTGQIVMMRPNGRKIRDFYNSMGRYINKGRGNEMSLKDDAPLGDIQIATVLQYVYDAPFEATIDGFLGYSDSMRPGDSARLWADMSANMEVIDKGGPLADSPSAETVNSV